jgi:hypothetical protein
MTHTFDGLAEFANWYATLLPTEIDSMLEPFNPVVDDAITEAGAQDTFRTLSTSTTTDKH